MVTYRRVATSEQQNDAAAGGPTTSNNSRARCPSSDEGTPSSSCPASRSRSERISDKLHALAWVVAAYAIATYTHLFHTIFTDGRILRPIFHISIMLFSINIVLTLYLTVYLPFKFPVSNIHKTPASSPAFWEVYCPRVIPVMTGCGVVGSLLLVRACYPVWGFLTPLILGVVTFGFFFSLHFIPWCW